MEMKKIVPLLALVLVAIVTATTFNYVSPISNFSDGIVHQGTFCVYKNDELVECSSNIITNRGRNLIRDDMMGTAIVTLDILAIANNTVAQSAADVNLQGEWNTCGLARGTGTLTAVGTGNWSISREWTSTCDNVIVNATGIYNTTASGNLFAQTTFTTTVLQTNDRLNVTYFTWIV